MKLVLGLGCDRGTSLLTIETAINQALKSAQLSPNDIDHYATIDKKNDEQAFLQLAEKYQHPISFYSAEQLAKVDVPSPSAVVMKYMGTPSVSEAAALLAANATMKSLVVEKFKMRGEDGKNATVSIAIKQT
ncbi:MAG: cobalamin biosynthesis protein [Methylococcales bacterium]|nr:cobalamin biosynthesis protein [Methylococcales bacterium]